MRLLTTPQGILIGKLESEKIKTRRWPMNDACLTKDGRTQGTHPLIGFAFCKLKKLKKKVIMQIIGGSVNQRINERMDTTPNGIHN